jgi:hypothetical protein
LVRVSDPCLLPALRAHLAERTDCVVTAVRADGLDVTILGSYSTEAMDMETQLRVRAWEEAQRSRGIDVRVYWGPR